MRSLEKRLFASEQKISGLEKRPLEWVLKTEMVLLWILVVAFWIFSIVEIASKN